MEDKDFIKAIAAEPSRDLDTSAMSDAERREAEAFQAEMQALDATIAAALAVPVPELKMPELPEIASDNVVGITSSNKRSEPAAKRPRAVAPTWLAVAASVAIAAVLGVRFLSPTPVYESLAAEAIAHMDHEPEAMQVTSVPVSERQLTSVVNNGGVELNRDVGLISYAKSCIINGKEVPHLVLQGETGPITLLLMPEERVENATPLSGESINGVILPVGDGSIAIIGEREEDFSQIEKKVVDSVAWRI